MRKIILFILLVILSISIYFTFKNKDMLTTLLHTTVASNYENKDDIENNKPIKKQVPAQIKSYLIKSPINQKQLFWSLNLNSKTISLRFDTQDGKIVSEEKSFVSEVIARFEAYQLILNQRKKGYHLANRINMETLLSYKPTPVSKLEDYYTGEANPSSLILIEGDLIIDELDIDALHKKTNGLIVTGNLFVDGGIYNLKGDYGPALFVKGDVQADYLFGGGSEINLSGETYIHSYVIGHYNHGSISASGMAMVSINSDHNLGFRGQVDYKYDSYDGFDNAREDIFPSLKQAMGKDFDDLIDNYGLNHNALMNMILKDKKRSLKLLKNILVANKADKPKLVKLMLDGESIKDIENPTEEMQLAAVKHNGSVLEYIKNPSESVIIAAISDNVHMIKLIENPSEKIQLVAVNSLKYGAVALQYIKNPSEKVLTEAVKADGGAIEYIKNPSEKLQLLAVSRGSYNTNIKYIKNPSENVQLAAVKQYGGAIEYIKNPSEKVQLAAVKQSGIHLGGIKNPSEAIKLAAVKEHGSAIQYIKNPSVEIKLTAVRQDGSAIKFIRDPSEEIKLVAVKQDGSEIKSIKKPSEEIQLAAMLTGLDNFDYIKEPTKKVKDVYKRWKSCKQYISEAHDDETKRQPLLLKALDACADYPDAYLQYSKYLIDSRKDYDEAEIYFKKGIEVCPTCGQLYFEYGKFLYEVRKQVDKAEHFYIKAVENREKHDDLLFQYGVFLVNVRKDYDKAKIYTRKAVEEQDNPVYSINYAQVVLITGYRSDATYYLDVALNSDLPVLKLEAWFYRLAHYPEYYEKAQKELDLLLAEGHRSLGWNLEGNIERAKKDGFKNIQLLKDYAKRITSK